MNEPHADLFIRLGRAVELDLEADDYAQASDEGHLPPDLAAKAAWDASASLRTLGEKLIDLSNQQVFAARRFERAQRVENATGVEHRGGTAA